MSKEVTKNEVPKKEEEMDIFKVSKDLKKEIEKTFGIRYDVLYTRNAFILLAEDFTAMQVKEICGRCKIDTNLAYVIKVLKTKGFESLIYDMAFYMPGVAESIYNAIENGISYEEVMECMTSLGKYRDQSAGLAYELDGKFMAIHKLYKKGNYIASLFAKEVRKAPNSYIARLIYEAYMRNVELVIVKKAIVNYTAGSIEKELVKAIKLAKKKGGLRDLL